MMIDQSVCNTDRHLEALRWYFLFKEEQMDSLAESFYVFISSKSGSVKRIIKYMDAKKIDKIKLFKELLSEFFFGVLPFKVLYGLF